MYNRYIPQSDGSHRRKFIPDPPAPPQRSCTQPVPPVQPEPCPAPPPRQRPCPAQQSGSALGFLQNLLPKDFDTGDLMIILLLLLMAGDCQEDQNWAWLTLALYLFL